MPPSAPPDAVPAPARAGPWWRRAFGPLYLTVYAHRDDAEARRHAPSILRLLGVPPHARILDVACGEGRYARVFAATGYRVTGVDASHALLEEARRRSPGLPGEPTYVLGDMRDLPFEQQFEGAVSLFTSFGYFDDPGDDARVLEGVRRALVPGGHYLIDFLNAPRVRARLEPESVETHGAWRVETRRRVDEDDPAGPCVRKEVVVTDVRSGREAGRYDERVRMYDPDRLDALLSAAGLVPAGARLGDLDGRPWDEDAPRCVRVAARPRRARA